MVGARRLEEALCCRDVDIEWARESLQEYLAALRPYVQQLDRGDGFNSVLYEAVIIKEPVAKEIMRRVDPHFKDYELRMMGGYRDAIDGALKGLALLDAQTDLSEKLGPHGPELAASSLHPWVWNAAVSFWDSGHYAQAVEQAWKSINAHIQQLVNRRDVSDDALVNNVLSPNPPTAGQVRLRVPGDEGDLSRNSRQRGMHTLGQACVAGIRNIVAHEQGDIPEQVALEYLATLSTLARWIDDAELQSGG
jgi:Protein of unknown function (Hypoth_ymh).